MTIFYDFTYKEMLIYLKPPRFYTEEQVKEAVENPDIIHFTTSFKSLRAWVNWCGHKYAGEWLKNESMSPWKESPLWEDNRPLWRKKVLKFIGVCQHGFQLELLDVCKCMAGQ